MSDETVRGRIRNFLLDNLDIIKPPVLEIGSLLSNGPDGKPAWWAYNRNLLPDGVRWIGLDFQRGPNVDVVADIEKRIPFDDNEFKCVLCSEVMEHLYKPWDALKEMHRVTMPGGWVVITTLFSFPVHGYPDDYWRYTPSCMRRLLEDAGFSAVFVSEAGEVEWALANDKPGSVEYKKGPMHIMAVAQK